MHRFRAITVLVAFAFTAAALGETLDFSEPHPNVPSAVCPVCAKNRAMVRDKLRPGFRGEVMVDNEADYRTIRRILVDIEARDAVVLLRQSSAPKLGISRLEIQPKSVTVYHDMPTTAQEARIIHGNRVQFDADSFGILHGRAARMGSIDLHTMKGGQTVAERLQRELAKKAKDDLTVVMGHVNNEGHIVFHDGSSIAVSQIESPGTTWVFGCNTNRFAAGTPGLHVQFTAEIYYNDALSMSTQVVKSLAQPGAKLRNALVAFADKEAVMTTAVAGGVLLTQAYEEDE